jgi:5-methyltetrahydropteroyltriglutamate--homocysteine methyltransferase
LLSRAPAVAVAPGAANSPPEDILMQRSTSRILTTHTGSLPRPAALVQLLLDDREKPGANRAALEAAIRDAVDGVVAKQIECGLDIINDGEQGRTDYTVHVKDRLSGFEGPSTPPLGTGGDEFPELALLLKQFASPFQHRPACSGPIAWKDWPAVEADLARAKSATASATAGDGARQVFMTSPSPGQIARYLKNAYYPDDEAYLTALADVMKREYRAIVDAGFILQLDCPDLAMSRHMLYPHLSIADYRKVIAANVTALNRAVADIPAERMRMHVCWGSTIDPHHHDVPLRDIVDVVLGAKPQAVSFPGANPQDRVDEAQIARRGRGARLQAALVTPPGRCRFCLQAAKFLCKWWGTGRRWPRVTTGKGCHEGVDHVCGVRAHRRPHRHRDRLLDREGIFLDAELGRVSRAVLRELRVVVDRRHPGDGRLAQGRPGAPGPGRHRARRAGRLATALR